MILSMRMVHRTTPPSIGVLPPTRPVPAPRTVTGMRFSLHSFMMADTSSVSAGSTTASGICEP